MRLDSERERQIKRGFLKFLDLFIKTRKICFGRLGATDISKKELKENGLTLKDADWFIDKLVKRDIIEKKVVKNSKYLILDSKYTYQKLEEYRKEFSVPWGHNLSIKKSGDDFYMCRKNKQVKLSDLEGRLLSYLYKKNKKNIEIPRKEIKKECGLNNNQISTVSYGIRDKMYKKLDYKEAEAEEILPTYIYKHVVLRTEG